MRDFQAIADRLEIEALRGEFTDALMMRDFDRFAALFTPDGVWRIPYIDVELLGREEIRAGIERMQGLWDYFVQTTHPGATQLHGDTASGRAYILEFGQMRGQVGAQLLAVPRPLPAHPGRLEIQRAHLRGQYLDTAPLPGSAPQLASGDR